MFVTPAAPATRQALVMIATGWARQAVVAGWARLAVIVGCVLLASAGGCGSAGPPRPGSDPSGRASELDPGRPSGSPERGGVRTLLAAGDVAICDTSPAAEAAAPESAGGPDAKDATAAATARLLDAEPGTVAVLGDVAQVEGAPSEYFDCYAATWGRHRGRTRPAPGNHDYLHPGAAGYFRYFGELAGTGDRGYYAYELGAWHVVALNSNCEQIGGCGTGSRQLQWLRADLAASRARCTLAYWHHPLFSSGWHGSTEAVRELFAALYDAGAEIVLNGHDHDYERFAPQNPAGERDERRGIRQFVVGTGGAPLRQFGQAARNSEARVDDAHGVLKLTLREGGFEWRFLPAAEPHSGEGPGVGAGSQPVPGGPVDAGRGTCH